MARTHSDMRGWPLTQRENIPSMPMKQWVDECIDALCMVDPGLTMDEARVVAADVLWPSEYDVAPEVAARHWHGFH